MNDKEFAYKVRAKLIEAENQLDRRTLARLKSIRQQALKEQKLATQITFLQSGNTLRIFSSSWQKFTANFPQLSASLAILTLVVGLVTLQGYEDMLQAQELADVDSALLTDDLPPEAYADSGFNSFLKNND